MLARWRGGFGPLGGEGVKAAGGGLRYVTGVRKGSREVTNHNRFFFGGSSTDWGGSGGLLQPCTGYKMTIGSSTLVGRRVCAGRCGGGA